MSTLSGTGVALVTPFSPSGAIDSEGLRKVTRHVIDGGVDYLVILGTTGEAATLTASEQLQVIDTVLEASNDEVPYVLGAGGNNTAQVCTHIGDWSKRYKPAAFLSVSPYYNKPSQEGIYQHFKAISESTDEHIILYNVPGRTAMNMSSTTSLRIAHEFANVVAIKEASGDLEQCMDLVRNKPKGFEVLSGDDTLVLPQLAAGFDGIISVAANAIPKRFTDIVKAGRSGDFKAARKAHYRILEIMRLFFAEGNPAGVKAALSLLDVCGPDVRLPLVKASEGLTARIKMTLEGL